MLNNREGGEGNRITGKAVGDKRALAAEFSRCGELLLADGTVMRSGEVVGIRREVSADDLSHSIRYYASSGHGRGRSIYANGLRWLPASGGLLRE